MAKALPPIGAKRGRTAIIVAKAKGQTGAAARDVKDAVGTLITEADHARSEVDGFLAKIRAV